MVTMALNAIGNLLAFLNQIQIKTQNSLESLPCVVCEIGESQDYTLPQFPIENGEYRGDTIYRMPLKVNARLFVEGSDYNKFETMLNDLQFSEDFITIKSLSNKVYKNLKITSWARDTTSQMIGACYYNVAMQEVILIDSLSGAVSNNKKAGYGKNKAQGEKNPQTKKSTALFDIGKKVGF